MLVHGGMIGGNCWNKVSNLLVEKSHNVHDFIYLVTGQYSSEISKAEVEPLEVRI